MKQSEVGDRDGQSIEGRTCEIASRRRCAEPGSAQSKSEPDIGTRAAGLAVGAVGRTVKAKVEIRDRDSQSIKGRTCNVAGRRRCTEHLSAEPKFEADIGASAAGLAMSRFGLEVEAKFEIRDRDKNSTSAGLATLQGGVSALSRAAHGQSRRQTSVQARPDLPRVESAKKSKQIPRSEIETANRFMPDLRGCQSATVRRARQRKVEVETGQWCECSRTCHEHSRPESHRTGRSRKQTSVRVRPDLPRVESAKKSKQTPRSKIETANRSMPDLRGCQSATVRRARQRRTSEKDQSRMQTSVRARPDLPWAQSAEKSKQKSK